MNALYHLVIDLPYHYRNIILTLVSPCINPTLMNERTVSCSDYYWDDPEGAADKDDDDVADEIPEESKAI